jgi:hypothetical protein
MEMLNKIDSLLSSVERKLLNSLDSPIKIQSFLNSIPYSDDNFYRCPLRVLRDRKGHCFDGALFAAMALRHSGRAPLIMELIPNRRDDDHVIALYKDDHCWGAIAQSNFTGLRFREPVYHSLRELVMSYFEDFFNSAGEKTLIGYRSSIDLKVFDSQDWMTSDDNLEKLSLGMDRYKIHPLISEEMAMRLSPVDERCLRAGLLGANPDGLFKVPIP